MIEKSNVYINNLSDPSNIQKLFNITFYFKEITIRSSKIHFGYVLQENLNGISDENLKTLTMNELLWDKSEIETNLRIFLKNQFSRLKEILFSRLILKFLILHKLKNKNLHFHDIAILKNQNSKLFFKLSSRFVSKFKPSNFFLSLSHHSDMICAIISTNKIGIDCEKIREFTVPLVNRFINSNEIEIVTNLFNQINERNINAIITAIWCTKEAAFKLYNLKYIGKISDLQIIIEESEIYVSFKNDEKNLSFRIFLYKNTVISICVLVEERN